MILEGSGPGGVVRQQSSGLSLESVATAEALPPEWEALRREEQLGASAPLLRAFEAAKIPGVQTWYLLARRRGQLVAGAALHRVCIPLDEQRFEWTEELRRRAHEAGRPDLLRFQGAFCGLNVSQGRDDIVCGAEPPDEELVGALADEAEREAAEQDLDGVLFGHLHPDRVGAFRPLAERGYIALPSLPYASLPIRWRSFEEYVSELRSGYRRQARAALESSRALGIEVRPALDLAAHAEEFTPLYRAIVARAEQRIEVLSAAFFRGLAAAFPGRASLVGLCRGERLVAGAVVVQTAHRLACLEVGVDDAVRGEGDIYPSLLLALVERACALGVERLDLGQAAADAKARLGCELTPTWLLVKPRSPVLAAALRVERPHLHPPALPVHHVLRESAKHAEPTPLEWGASSGTAAADGGDWARNVNPELAALLGVFRLDRTFVRGDGMRLWDSEGREVLDATSGYGALPFGHNPKFVWEAISALGASGVPQMVPGTLSAESGRLARELCRLAPPGLSRAVFANSGAEAVEVAIKAARARRRRAVIVVAEGAFHGKTLGALSATPSRYYQDPFFAPAPGFVTVPYGDAAALEQLLAARHEEIAAVLLEPILGEGGIIVPPSGYLKAARDLCDRHGILLLVDEVQTGLGRAGRLFACEEEGVSPDALAISKALGGGVVPAAACLLSDRAWSEELALRHSSTFAGNAMAATVGLAVLKRLTSDGGALLAEVRRKGDELRGRLRRAADRIPVLAEVRGRGLMVGLEVGNLDDVPSPVLRHLGRTQEVVPLLCSALLHRHAIRVLPPLSRKSTLRLIVPLDASDEALARVAEGVEDVFERLWRGDIRRLAGHLIDPSPSTGTRAASTTPIERGSWKLARRPSAPAGRFAFLVHPLGLATYPALEPSLSGAENGELAAMDRLMRDLVKAIELSHVAIRSATGAECEGWFIGLPFTPQGFRSRKREELMPWFRAAVELAKSRGAEVLGLGAFTSVASAGGLALRELGIGLTTGSAYTAAASADALLIAACERGLRPEQSTAAVIGAAGSVGRTAAILLAEASGRVLLAGNPEGIDTPARLERVAGEIHAKVPGARIEVRADAKSAVSDAQLVLSTTSAAAPIVRAEWLQRNAVVCDVARPSDLSADVCRTRPDVEVIEGGLIQLPEPLSLGFDFGLERGHVFACMAETMLLALEGRRGHYSLGVRSAPEKAREIVALAARHGFRVARQRY